MEAVMNKRYPRPHREPTEYQRAVAVKIREFLGPPRKSWLEWEMNYVDLQTAKGERKYKLMYPEFVLSGSMVNDRNRYLRLGVCLDWVDEFLPERLVRYSAVAYDLVGEDGIEGFIKHLTFVIRPGDDA